MINVGIIFSIDGTVDRTIDATAIGGDGAINIIFVVIGGSGSVGASTGITGIYFCS